MKIHHLWAISLGLVGCSTSSDNATPDESTIALIEAKLAAHPCISDLNKWERNYRFAKPTGLSAYTANIDHGVVDFHLRRAGTVAILPGRIVLSRHDFGDWPDGPYVQSVDGQFDTRTHALRMPRCTGMGTTRKN